MSQSISRRSALRKIAGTAAVALAAVQLPRATAADPAASPKLKGRIHHAVSRWCFGYLSLDELCKACKEIGIQGIDLVQLDEIPTINKHGLTCTMVSGTPGGIPHGLNRTENHDKIVAYMEKAIPECAKLGAPNIICFSGNRAGMDDKTGLENCAIGLKRIMPVAEKHNVTVCMELLNSKVNHKDYQCDYSAWGVELCKKVGSDRFKLLYDIYHMQIMEGNLIATIKKNYQYFGHYHTAGVPGRHEIGDTQEIFYPAVMKAIAETGYKGFVAQEFSPTNADKLQSLRESIQICDV